jgi:hypothetical protein
MHSRKGQNSQINIQWLTHTSKGISAKHMRQFYIAVVIPKILYTADVFLVPESMQGKDMKGHVNKLA